MNCDWLPPWEADEEDTVYVIKTPLISLFVTPSMDTWIMPVTLITKHSHLHLYLFSNPPEAPTNWLRRCRDPRNHRYPGPGWFWHYGVEFRQEHDGAHFLVFYNSYLSDYSCKSMKDVNPEAISVLKGNPVYIYQLTKIFKRRTDPLEDHPL